MEGNNYSTLDRSSPKIQSGNYNITQYVTLSWYVSKRDFDINRLVLHPIIHKNRGLSAKMFKNSRHWYQMVLRIGKDPFFEILTG